MSVTRWKPHNGYNVSNLVQGLTTYMNIIIITTNPIPSLGRIELSYSNVNIDSTIWAPDKTGLAAGPDNDSYCFVEWIGIANSCATTAGKVTVEFE
mmetsp:Transcript_26990/g.4973  ORF Transcript_26990/g.4973 Transcript_26990/m.4973 type:complete len:96 (+) Transcript_26990:981-1268(+)